MFYIYHHNNIENTDVKMISIFFASRREQVVVIRSGSGLIPSYFHPSRVVDYMKKNYLMEPNTLVSLEKHSLAFLKTFCFFGCDYNPGFYGITHSGGLKVFDQMSKSQFMQTENDFLQLLMNVYIGKKKVQKPFISSRKLH